MKSIYWIHDDCLGQCPDVPAIYVFDDAQIRSQGWDLKRIGFIYECLLELPVTIRRGDPYTEVRRFVAETQAERIITTATPDPHLTAIARRLHAESVEPPPFVNLRGPVSLRRFSQYWKKAEPLLIR